MSSIWQRLYDEGLSPEEKAAFASRSSVAPEQAESPPSADAETIYARTLLDDVEAAFNQLDELQDTLIHLENQEAATNRRRLNYSPWFPISVNRPGDEPYIPALLDLRQRLCELWEDLRERAGEED